MTANQPHRRQALLAILGLTIALGLPQAGLPRLFPNPRLGHELFWIALAGFMLLWVTQVERLPLSSIGLRRPRWGTLGWGLLATVVLMATVMLTYAVIAPALGLRQNMKATAALVHVPLWLFMLTPIVAGITEEIVYRGYAIERFGYLTGRRWLGAVLAGGFFLAVHWWWGATQLIVVGFATVILSLLYLWRRDLPCVMLAHILTDLIGLSLARAQM